MSEPRIEPPVTLTDIATLTNVVALVLRAVVESQSAEASLANAIADIVRGETGKAIESLRKYVGEAGNGERTAIVEAYKSLEQLARAIEEKSRG